MAKLLDEYVAIAPWDVSTRQTNEGFIRRTIKPALGHLQVRKVRGPILDKLYAELKRCGDLSCTGRPFTEHRNIPALVINPRDPRPAWQQVTDTLTEAIRSGFLASGDELPSITELVALQGIGTGVMRHALEALAAYLDETGAALAAVGAGLRDDAYLFSNDPAHSRPWNPDWVTHQIASAVDAAEVKFDIKGGRHYTASQLLAGGFDLRNTAARLGHSGGGATTLRHYADPVPEADRRAAVYLSRLTSNAATAADTRRRDRQHREALLVPMKPVETRHYPVRFTPLHV